MVRARLAVQLQLVTRLSKIQTTLASGSCILEAVSKSNSNASLLHPCALLTRVHALYRVSSGGQRCSYHLPGSRLQLIEESS